MAVMHSFIAVQEPQERELQQHQSTVFFVLLGSEKDSQV